MKNIVAFAMKEYGHYYNHDTDTLTVTKNFLKNSEQMDTPECKTIVALYALHPNMKIVLFFSKSPRLPKARRSQQMNSLPSAKDIALSPFCLWRMLLQKQNIFQN